MDIYNSVNQALQTARISRNIPVDVPITEIRNEEGLILADFRL